MAVLLSSAVASAGVKVLATSLVLVVGGALMLPGLVVGDAQWQSYTDRGVCDSTKIIYSTAPKLKDGVLGKISLATPCNEWYEFNRGDK